MAMKSPFASRLIVFAAAWLLALLAVADGLAEEAGRRLLGLARAVYHETNDDAFRTLLRGSVRNQDDDRAYGLRMDANWLQQATASPQAPLVVLIHGYNSSAVQNASVMAPIHAGGFPSASFSYPNDSSVDESAALLSQQLKAFAQAHPKINVALVTHSMGGLVARACIEDSALDPGNVTQLLMIAPPTHGTPLARTAVGADLWEHWLARQDGNAWTRWRDSVTDGLGEAADDLLPGSAFLTRLNARERNPHVRYAIFLGTHSPITEYDRNYLRSALQAAGSHIESVRDIAASFDSTVANIDEIVDGTGDGVVSVERGRLQGVTDTTLLPFDHLSCTGEPTSDAVRQLQKELLARLR
jgi:pimeloyl-ACP methyl ester carboxylesterase